MGGKKIKGDIVHWSRDEYGEVVVADDGGVRSLYFGDILQSSIRLDRPGTLIEDYSRAMMCPLIFRDDPRSVLLIGLGGGSLVHFLLGAFPDCSIDVAELRKQVINAARDFFLLQVGTPNLEISHAAGEDLVRRQADRGRTYDLIIVDAFDEDGPAASLLENDFAASCLAGLNEGGIFAINLWSRPRDNFPAAYEILRQAFGNNALKLLPGEAYWNAVVLGSGTPGIFVDLPSYRPAARQLRQKYGIDFPKYLKFLYWQNFE
jgi:spermidine synthase